MKTERRIQNSLKHLRWSNLQKELCLSAGGKPGIFQSKMEGKVCGTRPLRLRFCRKHQKKRPLREIFWSFFA